MRILLAIDDSKFSEAAVEAVIAQARPHGTEVRVLHVVEAPPLLVARELGGYEPALQNAMEFQKEQADALVAKIAEVLRARNLEVTTALEVGDPKSQILDVAEQWHAELDRTWLTRTQGSKPFSDGRGIRGGGSARLLFRGDREDLSGKYNEPKTGNGRQSKLPKRAARGPLGQHLARAEPATNI